MIPSRRTNRMFSNGYAVSSFFERGTTGTVFCLNEEMSVALSFSLIRLQNRPLVPKIYAVEC